MRGWINYDFFLKISEEAVYIEWHPSPSAAAPAALLLQENGRDVA